MTVGTASVGAGMDPYGVAAGAGKAAGARRDAQPGPGFAALVDGPERAAPAGLRDREAVEEEPDGSPAPAEEESSSEQAAVAVVPAGQVPPPPARPELSRGPDGEPGLLRPGAPPMIRAGAEQPPATDAGGEEPTGGSEGLVPGPGGTAAVGGADGEDRALGGGDRTRDGARAGEGRPTGGASPDRPRAPPAPKAAAAMAPPAAERGLGSPAAPGASIVLAAGPERPGGIKGSAAREAPALRPGRAAGGPNGLGDAPPGRSPASARERSALAAAAWRGAHGKEPGAVVASRASVPDRAMAGTWGDGGRDQLAPERRASEAGRSETAERVLGGPVFALAAPESGPSLAAPDSRLSARRVARQVAEHPVLRAGGAAELSLAPAELGHLRLSVEQAEGGLRVVIEAARPETADLMRRHVETLRQELRQEGLGSVDVSIGGGDSRDGSGAAPGRSPGDERPATGFPAAAPEPAAAAPAARLRDRGVGGHIDLRF